MRWGYIGIMEKENGNYSLGFQVFRGRQGAFVLILMEGRATYDYRWASETITGITNIEESQTLGKLKSYQASMTMQLMPSEIGRALTKTQTRLLFRPQAKVNHDAHPKQASLKSLSHFGTHKFLNVRCRNITHYQKGPIILRKTHVELEAKLFSTEQLRQR